MMKRIATLVVPALGLLCSLAMTQPTLAQDQVPPPPAMPAHVRPTAPAPPAPPARVTEPTLAPDQVPPPPARPAQVKPAAPTPPAPPARVAEPTPEGQADRAPSVRSARDAEAANVRIEIVISYQVGTAAPVKRSAALTVADQESGSLRAGNQIAVPSTTFAPMAKSEAVSAAITPPPPPVTSFSYRSVGINLDARRVYISGSRAKLTLSVEFSAIDEKPSAGPPSFPTFSQSFTLVVESGKPVVVAQSSDIVDGVERKQSVEVKATILR